MYFPEPLGGVHFHSPEPLRVDTKHEARSSKQQHEVSFPVSPLCNHGEGQEGERVRHARLHHPPQQAVVWRYLQEARAAGGEGGEEVRPADDEDQVCGVSLVWCLVVRKGDR